MTEQDFFLQVALGDQNKMIAVNKFGLNPDIDIGTEDIWGVGGTHVPPTSAGTVNFASGSANDTAAGTGARTITVYGLNENYDEVSETITLNGASNVATTKSYFIIHRCIVNTAGSGGTNAGAITGVSTGGGTPTMITIIAGKGQSQFGIYQVPAGYTAAIFSYSAGMQGGTALDVELFIKPFGGVFNLKGTIALLVGSTTLGSLEYKCPILATEKSIIKLVGTATANNTECHGTFDLVLIKNS